MKVLVCGTNYGHRYLEAVRREPDRYELAGVFARGSLRSILRAAEYRVPLYSSVAEVPADVEAAFAAMDPSGNEAVLELLRRGVHVLCEHPVSPAFLQEALDAARGSGAAFHVNAHFADLDAPRAFIGRCRARPLFLEATLTPRLIYALVDVLRRAMGPLEVSSSVPRFLGVPRQPEEPRNPFRIATASIAHIPTALHLERLVADGSAENVVDLRIAAYFPDGILTLVSLVGPVIWTANARRNPEAAMVETLFAQEGITRDRFDGQRLDANRRAMAALFGPTPPDQTPEHLLDVSRAAEILFNAL